MKKHLAISHSKKHGTFGVRDFDTVPEAEEQLEKMVGETKVVLSSEDEIFDLLKSTKEPLIKKSLGVVLGLYNLPEVKKIAPVARPMPKIVINPEKKTVKVPVIHSPSLPDLPTLPVKKAASGKRPKRKRK